MRRRWALPLWLCAEGDEQAPPASGVRSPWSIRWHSQYGQDRFVYERFFATAEADAAVAGRPRVGGVFVELGAADGDHLSNTLAFEESLGWTGVLIEASDDLFRRLEKNRPKSACVHECVARVPGSFEFQEDGLNSGFSEQRILSTKDADLRPCRTLTAILDDYLPPGTTRIDYLSLPRPCA